MGRKKGVLLKGQTYDIDRRMRFLHYRDRIKSIAMSRFKYKNMPPEIDIRFMEMALFDNGCTVFYRDIFVEQYVCLTTMYGGELDIYNRPSLRVAYAANGYQYDLTNHDSVMIWNNYLRETGILACNYFASRLANAESVIDINMKAQKTPMVILAPEEEQLTLRNTVEQYEDETSVIYGNKSLNLKAITTLETGANFIADKAQDIKTKIWNEMLTYYGIPNITENKKERMITDEVSRMMGGALASGMSDLDMRRQCFDDVNKMFGLNIEVEMLGHEDMEENVSRETLEEGEEYE